MPNIASILKAEIVRLARREIKVATTSARQASARHRRELAQLKRSIASLEKITKVLDKQQTRTKASSAPPEQAGKLRFRASGFKSMRAKAGLSAQDMGRLVGVSAQTIYAWEQQKSAPRRSQLPAIAAVRGLGKREIADRLSP